MRTLETTELVGAVTLVGRVELRQDRSSAPAFPGARPAAADASDTFGVVAAADWLASGCLSLVLRVIPSFKEHRLLNVLVGAFVVVALSFTVGAIVTRSASSEIERSTSEMLNNGIPSVTAVMNARTALRGVEIEADELDNGRGPDWQQLAMDVRRAQQELLDDVRAEAATPWYPGELELYNREILPKLTTLDRAIGDLENAGGASVPTAPDKERIVLAAITRVNTVARDLDASLRTWAEVNHTGAFLGAMSIAGARQRMTQVAIVMQAVSALGALTAAGIAILAARRFGRLADRNLQLEIRRGNELDLLAQRVAHDLMSPLAAVSLSLGAIQKAVSDESVTRAVDRARRALDRSRQLVQGIYQFACSGGQPTPGARAPLRATVGDAIDDLVAAGVAAPSELDLGSFEEVEVACDGAALGIIVSNLLSNSAKFSKESAIRSISVRAVASDRRVRLEIEDSGPGVPPGHEQAIFEPYRRAPGVTQPGLGLGLATVKRIVVAYGGAVGVRRAKTGGAIFWFELPRAPKPAEATAAEERAASSPGEGPAVGVVGAVPRWRERLSKSRTAGSWSNRRAVTRG
jgi:signal transduction histidine kinase